MGTKAYTTEQDHSFTKEHGTALLIMLGSSGINGPQIFVCYCDGVLGHQYLL